MATDLQAAMIKAIATNEFTQVNGAEPDTQGDIGWVWADGIIEDAQDKGVFASLVNAGLAEHSGHKGRDAAVTLTAAGFEAYKSLQPKESKVAQHNLDTKRINMPICGALTEVTMVARRGSVLYGVCLTAFNDVSFLQLLESDESLEVVKRTDTITFRELQNKEESAIDHNIRVTVHCFAANAYLIDAFPGIEARLCAKVKALIASIPPAEAFDF